ncbi:EF-hand domain-containing protein [bacterium]|nr:EF-hand domain-containing protein [bacterium]
MEARPHLSLTSHFLHLSPQQGIPYKLVCALILWWILGSLLTTELYLANSAPSAYIELWASSKYDGELGVFDYSQAQAEVYGRVAAVGLDAPLGEDEQEFELEKVSEIASGYCDASDSNNAILLSDGDQINFQNLKCAYAEKDDSVQIGDTHVLFVTARRDTYVARRPMTNEVSDDSCDAVSFEAVGMGEFCDGDDESVSFRIAFGSCFCERADSRFVAAAEHLTFSASHAYESRFKSGVADVTHVRVGEDEESILATFGKGEDVKIPIVKMLQWLDVDLDSANEEEVSKRVAGVRVEASFQYYNFHQAPGLEERVSLDEGPMVCIITLEIAKDGDAVVGGGGGKSESHSGSNLGWFHTYAPLGFRDGFDKAPTLGKKHKSLGHTKDLGTNKKDSEFTSRLDQEQLFYLLKKPDGTEAYVVRRQDGVRISVGSGGVISRLDFALLLETFVQAFLLLSFSNILMKFVAYTLLGMKSRVYKEFGEHEVQYEREYARFAVQSIVASHAFERLDVDNSGTITESELVDALRLAQGPNGKNDENDLRTLAAYIIACGDVDGDEAGDGNADGEISVTEWFDLFGSGHADSQSIRDNLRSLGVTEMNALKRSLSEAEKLKGGNDGRKSPGAGNLFGSKTLRRGLATSGFLRSVSGMEQTVAEAEEQKKENGGYGSTEP